MKRLTLEIVQQCKKRIVEWQKSNKSNESLPECLQPNHLLWMCDLIQGNDWPETKSHRWIGFIQAGMICSEIIDLEEAKSIVSKAKETFDDEKTSFTN